MNELIEKLKQILGCVSGGDLAEANELADEILAVVSPTIYKVSAQEVYNVLVGKYPNADILLWDEEYYLAPLEEWKLVLEDVAIWARKHLPVYKKNKFNCENFALAVWFRVAWVYMLNSLGIATGAGHGFNLIVAYEDGKIVPHTYDLRSKGEITLDLPWLVVDRTVILG